MTTNCSQRCQRCRNSCVKTSPSSLTAPFARNPGQHAEDPPDLARSTPPRTQCRCARSVTHWQEVTHPLILWSVCKRHTASCFQATSTADPKYGCMHKCYRGYVNLRPQDTRPFSTSAAASVRPDRNCKPCWLRQSVQTTYNTLTIFTPMLLSTDQRCCRRTVLDQPHHS